MNPDQDPWDHIHDCDRDEKFVRLPSKPQSHDKPSAKGLAPIILILVGISILGSAIGYFGYSFLNSWLQLP